VYGNEVKMLRLTVRRARSATACQPNGNASKRPGFRAAQRSKLAGGFESVPGIFVEIARPPRRLRIVRINVADEDFRRACAPLLKQGGVIWTLCISFIRLMMLGARSRADLCSA